MNFRKKPVVISAVQWDGTYSHARELENSLGLTSLGMNSHPPTNKCSWWKIGTLEGGHVVSPLDWIITGVKGEHYPCKPDIFELTYESTESTEKQINWSTIVEWWESGGENWDEFKNIVSGVISQQKQQTLNDSEVKK